MNIALIGSGGREHALCQKIHDSNITNQIYCIPGNAGTSIIAINLDIDFLNFNKLLSAIKFYNISLVIVGPELPLVKGIVDFLRKNKIRGVEKKKLITSSDCESKSIVQDLSISFLLEFYLILWTHLIY